MAWIDFPPPKGFRYPHVQNELARKQDEFIRQELNRLGLTVEEDKAQGYTLEIVDTTGEPLRLRVTPSPGTIIIDC